MSDSDRLLAAGHLREAVHYLVKMATDPEIERDEQQILGLLIGTTLAAAEYCDAEGYERLAS